LLVVGELRLVVDGLDRAFRHTSATIDALARIDVEHVGVAVEAIHRADGDTIGETAGFAVVRDDESHFWAFLVPSARGSNSRMARAKKGAQKVELVPAGIRVGDAVVPLLAGTAHYWRLEPEAWRSALEGMRGLGLTLLDTYVPWGVHERGTG